MYTLTCDHCGKSFERDHPGRFCSLDCRGLAQTARSTLQRNCEACGQGFLAKRCYEKKGSVRFCSRECYQTGRSDRIPVELRFWNYVNKKGLDDCWLWTGCLSKSGYGKVGSNGEIESASRVSYRLAYGTIPKGKQINHTCDVRACVNPKHLYAGTAKENTQDAITRGRWRSPFV